MHLVELPITTTVVLVELPITTTVVLVELPITTAVVLVELPITTAVVLVELVHLVNVSAVPAWGCAKGRPFRARFRDSAQASGKVGDRGPGRGR